METATKEPRIEEATDLSFPDSGYIGIAAKFAEVFSQCYETPKIFFYSDFLIHIGAHLSGRVKADFDVPCQPRLYGIKVAPSAWERKSTASIIADSQIRKTIQEHKALSTCEDEPAQVIYGVGSAEALGKQLEPRVTLTAPEKPVLVRRTQRVILAFDELRRFEAKAAIDGSVLRPMINELYERNSYDNLTLSNEIRIEDGHLTFLANSTEETFKHLMDAAEFRDIGFLNRVLLVTNNQPRRRVASPKAPPEEILAPLREELAGYFNKLTPPTRVPMERKVKIKTKKGEIERAGEYYSYSEQVIPLTDNARQVWEDWYMSLEETDETARLDNLGMRLMSLLAFTSGRSEIDADLVKSILEILEYEKQVRLVFKPIEAENPYALTEQKILGALRRYGTLKQRDLYRKIHAERHGLYTFGSALKHLKLADEIHLVGDKTYGLTAEHGS